MCMCVGSCGFHFSGSDSSTNQDRIALTGASSSMTVGFGGVRVCERAD